MSKTDNKEIKFVLNAGQKHWVGDGFHVHGILRPTAELVPYISPFILMDYAAPLEFKPTDQKKGVGEHPHRGFETVTFAYRGEIEHRDSSGGGGIIGEGEVQWMTAGSGVVHEEFHSNEFSKKGGLFEMVQLWVNLPAKDKMTAPRYQALKKDKIPSFELDGLTLRVIAGSFNNTKGAAKTHTEMNIYDIKAEKPSGVTLNFTATSNTVLLIMDGSIEHDSKAYGKGKILVFEQKGTKVEFLTSKDFKGLILNGEPIGEPVVAHGPFVMNTKEEILEAFRDYQAGKMGSIPPRS